MKQFITPLLICVIALLFVQCGDKGRFKIAKGQVGSLTKETTIKDLDKIFEKDSIVKILSEGVKGSGYRQDEDEYLIFEKGGKHLLTIVPKEQLDSTSTLKSIEIFDPRYKTETGITVNSNFGEINANVKINKVESSLLSAMLFIDELNTTVAIDKEELGLKGFSVQKVSLDQIPDLAKSKSFVVWFN